jgi:hypothetical protein
LAEPRLPREWCGGQKSSGVFATLQKFRFVAIAACQEQGIDSPQPERIGDRDCSIHVTGGAASGDGNPQQVSSASVRRLVLSAKFNSKFTQQS